MCPALHLQDLGLRRPDDRQAADVRLPGRGSQRALPDFRARDRHQVGDRRDVDVGDVRQKWKRRQRSRHRRNRRHNDQVRGSALTLV